MRVKQLINNNIFGFVLGVLLTSCIGVVLATSNITSSDVEYLVGGNANVSTIEDVLDIIYEKASKSIYLASFISQGGQLINGNIYYHNAALTNGANDGSIRYSGANPNNYVCFGSDAITCPASNIYRIIGLIPVDVVNSTTNPVTIERQTLFKLIKNDFVTSTELGISSPGNAQKKDIFEGPEGNQPSGDVQGFYWSGSSGNSSNTWSNSTLNTTALNGTFLTNLGSTWSNKIATVMWKVGGAIWSSIDAANPINVVYTYEITQSGNGATVPTSDGKNEISNKIGLMYISDYVYAVPQSNWNTNPSSYSSIVANNWLYKGVGEWMITRRSDIEYSYFVFYTGYVFNGGVRSYSYGIRPTFYLNASTNIIMDNHSGTIDDPYRIS